MATKKVESELDPILPLPRIGKIPPVQNGEGGQILQDTTLMMVELPYRAFYTLWEHAERLAEKTYPRYVGGTMDHAAQMSLEAVYAFRNAAYERTAGQSLPILTEKEAAKIRKKEAKASKRTKSSSQVSLPTDDTPSTCPKCGPNRTVLRKKFKGEKVWKCSDCGHRWAREAPERPAERLQSSRGSQAAGKTKPASQKRKKRAKAKS